jgi:polar amino acid transport system permease protein
VTEGPGVIAGPLARPGAPAEADAENHRRTVRAIAFAWLLVAAVLGGSALSVARASSTDNGILGWFLLALPLAVAALVYGRRAEAQVVEVDGPLPDEHRARVARRVSVAAIALATMLAFGLVVWASLDGLTDVGNTFFSWEHISASIGDVFDGFKLNIAIFIVAEFFVLIWGLIVAIVRRLPGRAAAPLRWLMVVYVDVFRGLPAIVTIYLIVFGLPLTQLPIVQETADVDITVLGIQIDQLFILGVFALVLVYGAYVAEVYRSGIESVHWSQRAAARGLGLSEGQSLRYVVVPQAVRRVIPPLMNDFIGLQKDTALLNIVGVLEGFNLARIYAGNHFNLSSVTGLGICFLIITIPMTRLADYLVKRDQARMQGGGG